MVLLFLRHVINADTAIMGNGMFIHYCHKGKTLMALRVHWEACPLCNQKNPEYIPNKLVYTVINISNGNIILTFADMMTAIMYIQNHPSENLTLGDTGYVE